jgi:hypothetical protein
MKNKLIFSILVLAAFASTAAAQWSDTGKLNSWTLKSISRTASSDDSVYLKAVRAGKNKGYDRLVFEFTGGLPRYQIQYVRSGSFDTTGEQVVKVGGKAFMDINLQTLPYPDDPNPVDVIIPKGNQRLPVFREVKELEWFEGVRAFGIGLNSKRGFRVLELTKPYRLVIDFKQ